MPNYDARAVANFLLDHADRRGHSLTQLALLKLIYFSHGWYLARFNAPLVENDFEAWEHGPVIRIVRDCFKHLVDQPIRERACRLDIFTGELLMVEPRLAPQDADFVESIFDRYHVYSAWRLSDMTHEPGSPWDAIWNTERAVARVGLRIKNRDIKAYFDVVARSEMLS